MSTPHAPKRARRSGRYGKVYSDILTESKLADLMEGRSGHRAVALWALGLAWVAQHLTDGEIPRSALRALYARPADAEALVAAGFWETTDSGWRYFRYVEAGNITKSQVAELRAKGEQSACKRWMEEKGSACFCGTHSMPMEPNG